MGVLKIILGIGCSRMVGLLVGSGVGLIGMVMLGKLVKEMGRNSCGLFDGGCKRIMNGGSILVGI